MTKDRMLGELPEPTSGEPFPYMSALGIMVSLLVQMQDALLEKDVMKFQGLRKDLNEMLGYCEMANGLSLPKGSDA